MVYGGRFIWDGGEPRTVPNRCRDSLITGIGISWSHLSYLALPFFLCKWTSSIPFGASLGGKLLLARSRQRHRHRTKLAGTLMLISQLDFFFDALAFFISSPAVLLRVNRFVSWRHILEIIDIVRFE